MDAEEGALGGQRRVGLGHARHQEHATDGQGKGPGGAQRDVGADIGIEPEVGVEGSLVRPGDADLNAALQSALLRPELRGLEAAIQEAEAELRLGLSFSKPEYGLGVRYSREERDQIITGGMIPKVESALFALSRV